MFLNKCPVCGTDGKIWHKKPEVFICPRCFTIYSRYGLVLETEQEPLDIWT
jgi:hypothetical protein